MATATAARQFPFLDLRANTASIRGEIDRAIARVIEHGQFINGPEVSEFEAAWAGFCGTRFAVGASNGTSALHTLLHCAGVGPGDEVIVPSHTFMATVESILFCGAVPVFAEIQDGTMLLDPAAVEAALTPRTRAIVPVHLYGLPADMERLRVIADRANVMLFEDAAQAHGATENGRRAGALARGAAFSFFPGKNLGAFGDAGAITTDDEVLARRCKLFNNHGREGKFLHDMEGTNYRLDTIQAAILLVKLRQLEAWNARRQAIAAAYIEQLSGPPFTEYPVRWQQIPEGRSSAYHLFVIRVPREREAVRAALGKRGVGTGLHYPVPCHLQPVLGRFGYKKGALPVTERVCDEILSMPIGPEMAIEDVEPVCAILAEELRHPA